MAGNGPEPCGRQTIACRVTGPWWTTTVSGPSDVWPLDVTGVSVRTSDTRTNAHNLTIHRSRSMNITQRRPAPAPSARMCRNRESAIRGTDFKLFSLAGVVGDNGASGSYPWAPRGSSRRVQTGYPAWIQL